MVYHSDFELAEFNQYVSDHVKGTGIITPFTSNANWTTIADLRIQQALPGLPFFGNALGANNFRIELNIDNFLNLLNDDWGHWIDGPFFLDNDIVEADLIATAGLDVTDQDAIDDAPALEGDLPRTTCLSQGDCVYRYNDFRDRDFNFSNREKSVYKIRLGVRFEF